MLLSGKCLLQQRNQTIESQTTIINFSGFYGDNFNSKKYSSFVEAVVKLGIKLSKLCAVSNCSGIGIYNLTSFI